jgi:hypothetical protein
MKLIIIAISLLLYLNAHAQNQDGKFSNFKLPQNLKKVASSNLVEAYIDLNRRILNQDGSITAESVSELLQPQQDTTKSYALVHTYYCNEKDEKRSSYLEYYKYSGPRKTGDLIEGKILNLPKTSIKEKTISEFLFNEVCSQNLAQTTQTQNSSLSNTNAAQPTQSINKSLEGLPVHVINQEIIKKGINQLDLDIFLTMYTFIWQANHYINQTPELLSTPHLYGYNGVQWQRMLLPYKDSIKRSLDSYERVINVMASKMGISSSKFKTSVGIVIEIKKDTACRPQYSPCDPDIQSLKSDLKYSRQDITSEGIYSGYREFQGYMSNPGNAKEKNNNGQPGFEMHPSVFFEYYAKFIPEYYLYPERIEKLTLASKQLDEKITNQAKETASREAQRIENERKRQEFANSPEGKRQAAKTAEDERQRQIQYAKEFPFYAVISCGSNYNSNFPVFTCFNGKHDVHTELEIRNGSAYKMYTFMDIMQMPQDNGNLVIDLRQKFDIKMQNASDSFILNLKIYNRANQKVSFEKSASRFGVIRISN